MKRFLLCILLVPVLAAGYLYQGKTTRSADISIAREIILTPERQTHILYGDSRGGGHLHGVGKPCKSEFPVEWSAQRIIETTERIAANDNLDWKIQRNGYYVAESMEENLRVRVVLGNQREHIITAYPVNVTRNPCPANDNGNR